MAGAIAQGVIGKITEMIVQQAAGEVAREFNITHHFDWLKEELRSISGCLAYADSGAVKEVSVKTWLHRVRDLVWDVEDIVEECAVRPLYTTGVTHSYLDNPYELLFRYRVEQRIEEVKKTINFITKDAEQLKLCHQPVHFEQPSNNAAGKPVWKGNSVLPSESYPVGIEPKLQHLISLIDESTVPVIAVVGMGGAGKTFLLQNVFDRIKQKYEHSIWLSVSPSYSVHELQCDLASYIGDLMYTVRNVSDKRAAELIHAGFQGTKSLIVLDDVRRAARVDNIITRLGLPTGKESQCRVVVTTRNMDVCQNLGALLYEMDFLSEQESWQLFCAHAFGGNIPPDHLQVIACQIEKLCGKLPLTLKITGASLSVYTEISQWNSKLRQLMENADLNIDPVVRILKINYDFLPAVLKPCFCYLSFFPENEKIDCEYLINLWIAEGLIPQREDQWDVAWGYLYQLANLSLLEVWEDNDLVKYFKIHALVLDVAIYMSKENRCAFAVEYVFTSTKRILLAKKEIDDMIIAQSKASCPMSLRTLSLHKNPITKIEANFFSPMRLLRVLDLSKTKISTLPHCIGNLILLKLLNLSWTNIEEVPICVRNLKSLVLLDLSWCRLLQRLPEWISELKCLQHLNIKYCHYGLCSHMPQGISELVSLRVLRSDALSLSVEEDGLLKLKDIAKLTCLQELSLEVNHKMELKSIHDGILSQLFKMRHLLLACDYSAEAHLPERSNITSLVDLQILCLMIFEVPSWVCKLANLRQLILSNCDCSDYPALETMPNLIKLVLDGNESCREVPKAFGKTSGFPKLRFLTIAGFPLLEELPDLEDGAMAVLEIFHLLDCPRVEKVPEGLKVLSRLEDFFCEMTRLDDHVSQLSQKEDIAGISTFSSPPQPSQQQTIDGPSTTIETDFMSLIEKFDAISQLNTLIQYIEEMLKSISGEKNEITSKSPYMEDGQAFMEIIEKHIVGLNDKKDLTDSVTTEIEKVVVEVFKGTGKNHCVGVALSVVGFVLEISSQISKNYQECFELLKDMFNLGKHILYLNDQIPDQKQMLNEAVQCIVVGCIICVAQSRTSIFRHLTPSVNAASLQDIREKINRLYADLALLGIIEIESRQPEIAPQSQEFNAYEPVGIQSGLESVIQLLDLNAQNAGPRVVVVYGSEGIGKTTLADAVYAQIDLKMYKHCRIYVDQHCNKKDLQVLQQQILYELFQQNVELIDCDQGRGTICNLCKKNLDQPLFLYIDNVLNETDLQQLLRGDLGSYLPPRSRILVTSQNLHETDIFIGWKIQRRQYLVSPLPPTEARKILLKKVSEYNDGKNINALIELCGGIPLLLKIVGSQLDRNIRNTNNTILELLLSAGEVVEEKNISDHIVDFVYNRLLQPVQEAFLCICLLDDKHLKSEEVANIVGEEELRVLEEASFVEKSKDGFVIVPNIVRARGENIAHEIQAGEKSMSFLKQFKDDMVQERWKEMSEQKILLDIPPSSLGKLENLHPSVCNKRDKSLELPEGRAYVEYKSQSHKVSVQMEKCRIFLICYEWDCIRTIVDKLVKSLNAGGVTVVVIELLHWEMAGKKDFTLKQDSEGTDIHIPIFSKELYLTHLEQCLHICRPNSIIRPLFYDTNDDIKYQFYKTLNKLGHTQDPTAGVFSTFNASLQASFLPGWSSLDYRTEWRLVKRVVFDILEMLNNLPLHAVGLEDRMEDLIDKLEMESDRPKMVVGICGMGGIGKTTLAKAIFNSIGPTFQARSFVAPVKEKELCTLQEQILKDLSRQDILVKSVDHGKALMKAHLISIRALVILDDIDHSGQLEALNMDWLAPGSRLLLTSRDTELLTFPHADKIYHMAQLGLEQSVELFSWHAYLRTDPDDGYEDRSKQIAKACQGIPLLLEVAGASLYDRTETSYWDKFIRHLESTIDQDIHRRLCVMTQGLESHEIEIFLDIAYFFVGKENLETALRFWEAIGHPPNRVLETLIQNSLVRIDDKKQFIMHDLLQDMGRAMVANNSPGLRERSRVWRPEDAQVITKGLGTMSVQISISGAERSNVVLQEESFAPMTNLQLLWIAGEVEKTDFLNLCPGLRWLRWNSFPLTCLPSEWSVKHLTVLDLSSGIRESPSKLRELWSERSLSKEFKNLHVLRLSSAQYLERLPDFSIFPVLTELDLENCLNLTNIPDSIGILGGLKCLNLSWCRKLVKLPDSISKLSSLEKLSLSHCFSLKELPSAVEELMALKELDIGFARHIEELPNFGKLVKLEFLTLAGCLSIRCLPDPIGELNNLTELDIQFLGLIQKLPSLGKLLCLKKLILSGCESLRNLPESLVELRCLKYLEMNKCSSIDCLPEKFGDLVHLEELYMNDCPRFLKLPSDFENLVNLRILELRHNPNLMQLPSSIYELPSLVWFDASNCNLLDGLHERIGDLLPLGILNLENNFFCQLPPSICKLTNLTKLNLNKCQFLEEIPTLPKGIVELDVSKCTQLIRLPSMSDLKRLTTLILCNCEKLIGLPELSSCQCLAVLNISKCIYIRSLAGVKRLNSFKTLYFGGSGVSVSELGQHIEDMPQLEEVCIHANGVPQWLELKTGDHCLNDDNFTDILYNSVEKKAKCGGVFLFFVVNFMHEYYTPGSPSRNSMELAIIADNQESIWVTIFSNRQNVEGDQLYICMYGETHLLVRRMEAADSISVRAKGRNIQIRECGMQLLYNGTWGTNFQRLVGDLSLLADSYTSKPSEDEVDDLDDDIEHKTRYEESDGDLYDYGYASSEGEY